jgi:hypothetical protein
MWWHQWRSRIVAATAVGVLAAVAVAAVIVTRDSPNPTSDTPGETDQVGTPQETLLLSDPAWERERLYHTAANTLRDPAPANAVSGAGPVKANPDRLRILVIGSSGTYSEHLSNLDQRWSVQLERLLEAELGPGTAEVQSLSQLGATDDEQAGWVDAIVTGDGAALAVAPARFAELTDDFDIVIVGAHTGSLFPESGNVDTTNMAAVRASLRGPATRIRAFHDRPALFMALDDIVIADESPAAVQAAATVYKEAGFTVVDTTNQRTIRAREGRVRTQLDVSTKGALQYAYARDAAQAVLAEIDPGRLREASAGAVARTESLVSNALPLALDIATDGTSWTVRYDGGDDTAAACTPVAGGEQNLTCVDGEWVYTSGGRRIGTQGVPCAGAGRPHSAVWLAPGTFGMLTVANDGTGPVSIAAVGRDSDGYTRTGSWADVGAGQSALLRIDTGAVGTVEGFLISVTTVTCSALSDAALEPFSVTLTFDRDS